MRTTGTDPVSRQGRGGGRPIASLPALAALVLGSGGLSLLWGAGVVPVLGAEGSPGALPGATASMTDSVPLWEVRGDPGSADPVERGAYLARAGNCVVCHTEDPADPAGFMAGGKEVPSPFGAFHSTNITPDPETGIGGWSRADFVRSMREGRSPDGSHFYPSFPYTSFTGMTDGDLDDLYAFLQAVPSVRQENRSHDLRWFATLGPGLAAWKTLNFREWRFEPDPDRDEEWNRGAYLSQAVAHCAECHSPRTRTGAIVANRRYAGTPEGPDGQPAPNITPDETGITGWSQRHLERYLEFGMTPEGDFAGGSMAEIINHGTGYLTPEDRRAIAVYILSLAPVPNQED
jgi:mono/diheme cytochrome c family protein